MSIELPWDVLLVGGASGSGKTSLCQPLARHYQVGITEIDDFQVAIEAITTPDQFPALHLFPLNPDAFFRITDAERLAHCISCANEMMRVLKPVIENHLETQSPILLEGDFIHPQLIEAYRFTNRVRGLVLVETENQIAANYQAREHDPQETRARESWRFGEWLRQECEQMGVPVISARPLETVLDRAIAAIDG